ncbi:MAG: HlyD family efflux transporter periplasmic adaptor subunit [Burkholderiales bacterium]|nr:HlyD family efflux transporter periplasmic adaptor subunit [Burkholderiales bacterium]
MKTRTLVLWTLALGAAAALTAWALRPQPISVETAAVTQGRFEQTIDDDGKTRVRDRYTVAAPLAGRLLRIGFKAGDRVGRDAVVAIIVPSAPELHDLRTMRELEERSAGAQASVLRAGAMEARAKAALDQARADADRTARLAAEGFVSASSREQSELAARLRDKEFEAARFERQAAERELAQARAALLRVRSDQRATTKTAGGFQVLAPIAGQVLRVLHESEGPVAIGTGLLELGDIEQLEVVVDVLSTEAVAIAPGADASIDAGSDKAPLRGRVRRIEPSAFTKVSALGVEEQRVNVIIDLVVTGAEALALGDGYRVDARIVVHRSEAATLVPSGALFRDGDGFAVFVVEAGVARKRAVGVPRRNDRVALVVQGLQPGERVIVFPGDTVRDGVRIQSRDG